jgi:microcystin-dependent protein
MQPFLGEIRMFSGNFAPKGWAICQGQLLPINLNQSLFSLLGTTFGGNGTVNFALPDLRGRTPIHVSQDFQLGVMGGTETSVLTLAHMPAHTHEVLSTVVKCNIDKGNSVNPSECFPAGNTGTDYSYTNTAGTNEFMAADAIVVTADPAGSGQPFNNMMPYTCINFIISLQGIYPQRP